MKTETWNNCAVAHDGSDFVQSDFLKSHVLPNKAKILSLIKRYGKSKVWLDLKSKVPFSTSQNSMQGAKGRERSFLSPREHFLVSPDHFCPDCGGKVFCDNTLGQVLGTDTTSDTEYVIQNVDAFSKVRGKTVLIVGGGPSALSVDWEKYDFDHIWSCNHFFMNDRLKNRQVDLWMPSDEIYILNNRSLHNYLDSFGDDLWCCFYPTVKMKPDYIRKTTELIQNTTYAHMRYRSKIGIMPRLILLATYCGANNVLFAGMDGVPGVSVPHAFQPNKPTKGTSARTDAKDIFRRQYVQLWDYIINELRPDTEYFNLGENTSTNLTADISKKRFPLSRVDHTATSFRSNYV
jgi:hypothetical protein